MARTVSIRARSLRELDRLLGGSGELQLFTSKGQAVLWRQLQSDTEGRSHG